jgi:glycosyltransferase involved in cell wall biosynthesis
VRIGFLGTRGVPASYSGFETCAEELGARLVARGHEVTVYCRVPHITYAGDEYRGMRLAKLPTIRTKHLDTIAHAFLSALHALGQRYDVAMFFNVGVTAVCWIPRLAGQGVVLNVDGLDWRRVQAYYRERYGADSAYIAYGAEPVAVPPGEHLARLGLSRRRYVLFVGRLVPENCAHHLVDAWRGIGADLRCVIVGDAPYAEAYIRGLRHGADPRVVFTGYVFGDGYRELLSNAYAFVETSEVGGTHPALLEAMAAGVPVVVNDTPENLETMGAAGVSYPGDKGAAGLRPVLERLLQDEETARDLGAQALARVRAHYSWDRVTDAYEALFRTLARPAA